MLQWLFIEVVWVGLVCELPRHLLLNIGFEFVGNGVLNASHPCALLQTLRMEDCVTLGLLRYELLVVSVVHQFIDVVRWQLADTKRSFLNGRLA